MLNRLQIFASVVLCFLVQFSSSVIAEVDIQYFHTDALGSVVAKTNELGDVVFRERYRPFGETIDNSQSGGKAGDIEYTGKPHFEALNLSYYGSRWYDRDIGRFTGIDPVGWVEGNSVHSFARYTYANNNPYKYVDPDGEFIFLAIAIGSVAYSAYSGYQEGGASGALAEASGYNGLVESYSAVKQGEYGAAVYALGAVALKPLKAFKTVTRSLGDQNKLFKDALSPHKGTKLSKAGRGTTKHPEYFGFKNTQDLMKVYNTEAKRNKLAANTLKDIMRGGKATTGNGGRYPGGWKTYTSPDGRAASWHADGRFIGFRGVR